MLYGSGLRPVCGRLASVAESENLKTKNKRKGKRSLRTITVHKINAVRIGDVYLDVELPKHPRIIIPDGYDICDNDDCSLPAKRGGDVWCLGATNCNAGGCRCHLFKLKHPRKDNDWKHEADEGQKKTEEDGYDYGCLCLKKKP
jgi:hypothetical protein